MGVGLEFPTTLLAVVFCECVSYNIGPMINNKMACELSNSDHLQHPEDLKPRKDWIYRGTQV